MDILIPVQLFLRVKEKNYAHFAHKDKSLGRDPLSVYVRLFRLAVDTGSVSLPQRELADDVRISVRTLQKALCSLSHIGYVHVDAQPGQPSTYSLILSDHVLRQIRKFDLIDNPAWYGRHGDEAPERGAASGESDTEKTPPRAVREGCARRAYPSYKVYKNNKKESPLPPFPETRRSCPSGATGEEVFPPAIRDAGTGGTSPAESFTPASAGGTPPSESGFSKLWDAYPVKKAQHRARKTFLELAGDLPPLTRLLEVIAAFKADDDQWKRGYAPYLATWLRERRWDDEILRRGKNSENVAGTAAPVPRATIMTLPPRPVHPELSPDAEKNLREVCSALCELWPGPVNDIPIAAFLRRRAVSGALPASLPLSAKAYLAVAPHPVGLWRWLHTRNFEETLHGNETASRAGEGRISGQSERNQRVA